MPTIKLKGSKENQGIIKDLMPNKIQAANHHCPSTVPKPAANPAGIP